MKIFDELNGSYNCLGNRDEEPWPSVKTTAQRVQAVQDFYINQDYGPQILKSRNAKASIQMPCGAGSVVFIAKTINLKITFGSSNVYGIQTVELVKKNANKYGLFIVGTDDDNRNPALVVVR